MGKSVKSNWIDRTIGYISPESYIRRVKARVAINEIHDHIRRYEGASKSKRMKGWKTNGSSANTLSLIDGKTLRDRSRDLVRNNPYAERAVSVITSNTVGTGIIPSFKVPGLDSKITPDMVSIWNELAEVPTIDADGLLCFYGIQDLALRTAVESGEVLIRRRRRMVEDNLPLPLQIQVLEPDYLDTTKNEDLADGYIRQGIEFDKIGRRRAYHLFQDHPGEASSFLKTYKTIRVPADDIIHMFRVLRPGQIRGIPWGSPVIARMRDFDDYQDATLLRQKIAACFTAFVTDTTVGTTGLGALANSNDDALPETVSPGMIEKLGPGQSVVFGNPPSVDGYEPISSEALRAIAMGFGVTAELISGNLANVNFSSGRMGWLEFHRNIDKWCWLTIVPQLNNRIMAWVREAAILSGRSQAAKTSASWTPRARQMIDPVAETNATIKQIRAGLKSYPQAIRESGNDPEEVMKEIKDSYEKFDEFGLKLDIDGRHMTANGIGQSLDSGDPAKKTEGES